MTYPTMHARDLEAIVSLMEQAAVELTPSPDATFTADEMFATMQDVAGPSLELRRVDFDIVLPLTRFVCRAGGRRWRLR